MAQKRKFHQADSTQDSEKIAENTKPDVLSRLERLHAELSQQTCSAPSTGGNIRDEFTKQALSSFAELVAKVTQNPALSVTEKLDLLANIQDVAAGEAKKLTPTIPDIAPKLWRDREDPDANPFIWAHKTYGSAASIMVVGDYDQLDHALGAILARHKREGYPIPEGYYIQSKTERDKAMIEASPPSWKDLMAQLPLEKQRQFRAWKTAQSRNSVGKTRLK